MIRPRVQRSVSTAPFAALALLGALPTSATSQIVGRVLDDQSAGIPSALVRLIPASGQGLEVVADSAGNFRIASVPLGDVRLEVEALGFSGASRALTYEGRMIVTDLRVARDPIALDGLKVDVELRSPFLERNGFYHRQRYTSGEFLDFDANPPRPTVRTGQLFQRVAGVRVLGGSEPVFTRSQMWGPPCRPVVIVDDALVRDGPDRRSFEEVAPPPATIAAVELYPSGGVAPARWRSSSSMCGVIAIWTKR